jgi:hypothetical protein
MRAHGEIGLMRMFKAYGEALRETFRRRLDNPINHIGVVPA